MPEGFWCAFEDVFLHNSPEAFFRFITGKKGRKPHRKKDVFYEPTHLSPDFASFTKQRSREELEIVTYIYDGKEEAKEIQSVCAEFLKGTISEPVMVGWPL